MDRLTALIQAGPLDTAKPGAGDQPSPFIIVAQSIGPGDPFNDNTDRVAEASVLESGKSSPCTAKCCYRRLYKVKISVSDQSFTFRTLVDSSTI